MTPVVVRDTLTLAQIHGVIAEWDRWHAERDLAQLELITAAVAPLASKENQGMARSLVARLSAIAFPVSPRAAARALFARYKDRALKKRAASGAQS